MGKIRHNVTMDLNRHTPLRVLIFAAAVMFVITSGCTHSSSQLEKHPGGSAISGQIDATKLASEMGVLLARIESDAIGTGAAIAANTSSREVREASLSFRIDVSRSLDALQSIEDPRQQFLATWLTVVQFRQQLQRNAETPLFGDQHGAAVELAQRMEAAVLEAGRRCVSAERITAASDDIEAMASLRPSLLTNPGAAGQIVAPQNRSDLAAILAIPLAPVEGLRGVGDTPAAIDRFTKQAGAIGSVVRDLPQEARWNAELLMLEAENSGAFAQGLEAIKRLEKVVEETRQVAATMPANVGDQVDRSLKSAARLQPGIDATLRLATGVAQNADAALARAERLTTASNELAGQIPGLLAQYASAAKETRALLADIAAMQKAAEGKPADNSPPDWTAPSIEAASKRLEAAAIQVRGVLADIGRPPTGPTQFDAAADRMERLLNRAALYGAELAVLVFALALLYRRTGKRKVDGKANESATGAKTRP